MRTKTLLAAAVLAAGLASSQAQNVYSQNIVGYVTQVYPAGYSMVATPLKGTNDLVSTVLANAPSGTAVYKFTGGAFQAANTFAGAPFNVWSTPGQTLPAGQGYFIKSVAQWTNTFVGEVVLNNTNSLINGFNMIGSAFPMAGTIDTQLQLVPSNGDAAYLFNNGVGYAPTKTYAGAPFNAWSGGAPSLNVAQGVMYKSVGAKDWTQNFTIP